jgi:hypothetical protein
VVSKNNVHLQVEQVRGVEDLLRQGGFDIQ